MYVFGGEKKKKILGFKVVNNDGHFAFSKYESLEKKEQSYFKEDKYPTFYPLVLFIVFISILEIFLVPNKLLLGGNYANFVVGQNYC